MLFFDDSFLYKNNAGIRLLNNRITNIFIESIVEFNIMLTVFSINRGFGK